MSAMFAVYHGPSGLKHIGNRVHNGALILNEGKLSLVLEMIQCLRKLPW